MTTVGDRSQVERALSAITQLKSRVRELESAGSEPLAIVGMGCRFPGKVRSPDELWAALLDGRDLLETIPGTRWNNEQYYDSNVDAPGKLNCRRGGFVDDPERFDSEFFGISPREAARLDPQQRLLLEVSWEAIERAGLTAATISGSNTGVFVGMVTVDYLHMQLADLPSADAHTALGCEPGFAAGRLSYFLNLQGPSVTLNTLCSSSLVALHYACSSLRLRQCDRAIVAGVNSMLWPGQSVVTARFRALSPSGRCSVFDAAADGFVRSEGCGAVVVRRLSDALADGDPVVAVIRGIAHNHDGRGLGFTAPNGRAQEDVMRRALKEARMSAREVHFVEAHGTGTILGDPIELESIAEVYGHAGAEPCAVGAIKSNLGHTEAAAGMAGLIKLALCVQRGSIVPNVNFSMLNERVRLGDSRLFVPTRTMEWPSQTGARAGAVSCFGMSGTNTHVLVASQEAPSPQTSDASRDHYLVRLSAKSPQALTDLAQSYAVQLQSSDASLADVAFSANERRSVFEHRLCAVADSTRSLSEQLATYAQSGKTDANLLQATASPGRRLAFLFSGQGSLRAGAGLELHRTEPAFSETFERCRQILLPNGIDILALLRSDPSGLRRTRVAQPVMYALQCALVDLLGAWGIRPQVVIGHSVGEFAAAYCAGALDLEAGCRLVWRRAQLMDALPEGGEMRAFAGSEAALQRALTLSGSAAEVAAVNAETEVVVSGTAADLELLARELGTEGTPLAVSHAFHSALMDPMLHDFSQAARVVQCAEQLRCEFASTYLGRTVDAKDLRGDYWVRQLRGKVRFADAVKAAQTPAVTEWLEIGSRPLLLGLLGRNGVDSRALRLPTLVPREPESAQLLRTVAALHARGAQLEFRAIDRGARRSLVSVPTYQFQRERHWLETMTTPVTVLPDGATNSYELAWVPLVRLPQSVVRARHWLLLCPEAKLAGELTQLAAARGINARTVTTDALLRTLAEIDAAEPVEVVDVRPLLWKHSPNEEELLSEAASKQFAGCYDSARAVVDSQRDARLWLVTANAVGTLTDARPEGACAWGFGRSFDLEHPRHFGGLIDLCGAAYSSLVDEIADSDGERQVVLSDGIRRVARVSRLGTVPTGEFRASERGVFVVAGGTGSLGLRLSEWLVGRGARRIALLSRHAPELVDRSSKPELASVEILERLRAAGCELAAFAVDIADRDRLSSVFRQIEGTLGPIRGVLHAAGSSPRAPIATATSVIIEQTFRSKALGAANLHLASRGCDLELFLVASSISGVWGAPGFAHYAAANAFGDALIRYRRQLGLAGTSVQWGPWLESSWTTDATRAEFEASGVHALQTHEALAGVAALVASGRANTIVASLELASLRPLYQGIVGRRLFDNCVSDEQPRGVADAARRSSETHTAASAGVEPAPKRGRSVLHEVRALVAQVLRRTEPIDDQRGLYELGLDSILAVELRNRLEQALGVTLPATVALEQPNVAALAQFLSARLGPAAPESEPTATAQVADEAVAIIGIGCRMPGGAHTPQAFWELLREGRDAVGVVPPDRFRGGASSTEAGGRWAPGEQPGGFLTCDVFGFDTALFGISPREARNVDPQQRLLLEVAWEAIQEAGYDPRRLRGSSTGVFVACGPNDYGLHGVAGFEPAYYGTGNAPAAVSGRLSYALGLQGPSMTVDAACASSLVAVHLACESLLRGECVLAVAGGVSLMLDASGHFVLSEAGMLSAHGKCRTFDARADGYVRGEGCGVVTLKLLSRAIADGDSIWAVIAGSAVNQNGAGGGLTIPSASAQAQVITKALSRARVEPEQIAYVEAHGTGTALGDPVEVRALASVLRSSAAGVPVMIGSVKTNIGHLEPAAGIAGLIKSALICRHGEIPASLHFETPNPAVQWDAIPVRVVERPTVLASGSDCCVGVSSFGFTGTNAHLILRRAPVAAQRAPAAATSPLTLKVSGATPLALEANCKLLSAAVGELQADDLVDFCARANASQPDLSERVCIVGLQASELQRALLAACDATSEIKRGHVDNPYDVAVFLAPQSVSWLQLEGLALSSTLRGKIESVREQCEVVGGNYSSTRTFLWHVALVDALNAAGVRLSVVAGRAIGELAAARIAGYLSFDAALSVTLAHDRGMRIAPIDVVDIESLVPVERIALGSAGGERPPSVRELREPGYWESRLKQEVVSGTLPTVDDTVWLLAGPSVSAPAVESISVEPSSLSIARSVAALYCRGAYVEWSKRSGGRGRRGVPVVTYPFQREHLRIDRVPSTTRSSIQQGNSDSSLLGGRITRVDTASAEGVYELLVNLGEFPFLNDHVLYDDVVVPGTFHLATVLEVVRQHTAALNNGVELRDVVFSQPLRLTPNAEQRIQVVLRDGRCIVASNCGTGWTEHLSAAFGVTELTHGKLNHDPGAEHERSVTQFYEAIGDGDLRLGPSFRLISKLWVSKRSAQATLKLAESACEGGFRLFPGALDSALQTMAATSTPSADEVAIPLSIERVRWFGNALADGTCVDARLTRSDRASGNHYGDVELTDASGQPLLLIDGFGVRRINSQRFAWTATNARELIREIDWRTLDLSQQPTPNGGAWLVIGEERLATAQSGSAWRWPAAGVRRLPSSCDRGRLLDALASGQTERVVVIDAPLAEACAPEAASDRCSRLLELINVLADHDPAGRIELTVVTHRAMAWQGSSASDASGAVLWGLLRVVRSEHRARRVRLIDLAERDLEQNQQLLAALSAAEDEVVLRDSRALSWSLQKPQPLTAPNPLALDANGTYLITGGFGALGQSLAGHLLAAGAGAVALGGRNERPLLRTLREAGERVRQELFDVGDLTMVQQTITRLNRLERPLRGVFHLAAVTEDCSSFRLNREVLDRVFSPKLIGAWNLHVATSESNLQYFALYSSIAAWNGNPGQGGYAAASAGLATLAWLRWQQGQVATLLDWGPWAGAGMFGRSTLSATVQGTHASAALAALDWTLGRRIAGGHWLLAPAKLVAPPLRGARLELTNRNRRAAPSSRAEQIHAMAGATLGLDTVDEQKSLLELGLDSLMAVEIRARISSELGITIPLELLLSGGSIADVIAFAAGSPTAAKKTSWVEGEL